PRPGTAVETEQVVARERPLAAEGVLELRRHRLAIEGAAEEKPEVETRARIDPVVAADVDHPGGESAVPSRQVDQRRGKLRIQGVSGKCVRMFELAGERLVDVALQVPAGGRFGGVAS